MNSAKINNLLKALSMNFVMELFKEKKKETRKKSASINY